MVQKLTSLFFIFIIIIMLFPCVYAETPIISVVSIAPTAKVVGFTQTISVYLRIDTTHEIEDIGGFYRQAHCGLVYCEYNKTDEPNIFRLDFKIPSGNDDYMGDWYADSIFAHVKMNGHSVTYELSFNYKDTMFYVVNGPITPVEEIVLDQKTLNMNFDDQVTVTHTVFPINATLKAVHWSSNDKNIATVTNGIVTAKNVGATVITCESTDHSEVKASCIVIVHSAERVLLPEELEILEEEAFMDTGVQEVIIPNSVRSIRKNAFSHCKNLRIIYVPKSVLSIESGVFDDFEDLTILCEPDSAIIQYAENNQLNYIIVDDL